MMNCLVAILMIFPFLFNSEEDKFAREEGKVIKLITKDLSKRGYRSSGWGESVTDLKLYKLTLLFQIDKQVDIDTSRKMLYEIAQTILHIINNYKPIEKYLGEYPFTYKNLSIIVMPPDVELMPPYLYGAQLSNGRFNFTIVEFNKKLKDIYEKVDESLLKLM